MNWLGSFGPKYHQRPKTAVRGNYPIKFPFAVYFIDILYVLVQISLQGSAYSRGVG